MPLHRMSSLMHYSLISRRFVAVGMNSRASVSAYGPFKITVGCAHLMQRKQMRIVKLQPKQSQICIRTCAMRPMGGQNLHKTRPQTETPNCRSTIVQQLRGRLFMFLSLLVNKRSSPVPHKTHGNIIFRMEPLTAFAMAQSTATIRGIRAYHKSIPPFTGRQRL